MLSTTGLTTFLANRNRVGAALHAIVKLTDGTSTWYLSDTEMELTDGHVYACLQQISPIQSSADPFTKDFSVSDVTLTIINAPYHDDTTGRNRRLSDELGGIIGQDVSVYLMAGICSSLSECLLRFYGRVSPEKGAVQYDEDQITIQCVDKIKSFDREIPLTTFRDIDMSTFYPSPLPQPSAWAEILDQPVPLCYGTFTFDIRSPRTGTGLMKAFKLSDVHMHPYMVFASHSILGVYGGSNYYYSLQGVPLPIDSSFVQFEGTYFYLYGDDIEVNALLFPYVSSLGTYGAVPSYEDADQTSPNNAFDGSLSTYATVYDGDDTGTRRYSFASYIFKDAEESVVDTAITSNSNRSLNTTVTFHYKILGLATFPDQRFILFQTHGAAEAANEGTLTFDGSEQTASEVIGYVTAQGKADEYLLRVWARTAEGDAGANGVANDQEMLRIYDIYLSFNWPFKRDKYGDNPPEDYGWLDGQGRLFASWIDSVGRSNGYDEDDPIDCVAGIAESILRDELGMTDTEIDTTSFDACMASLGANLYIQTLTRKSAFQYIKQLVEQSPYMFTWTANSKARLIDLSSTPASARIIPFSHIKDGSLVISKDAPFATSIQAKSRYIEFYEEFIDIDNETNATTNAVYGGNPYPVEWPNIAGTAVDDLIDHLMGTSGSTGIWAQPHSRIDFETVGATNADLENGDRIELEAATFDGQVKLFGATWASKQFMVTAVEQTLEGTKISAMQL
jgi:hypothetical protein